MKLTTSKLKQIIKEEYERASSEIEKSNEADKLHEQLRPLVEKMVKIADKQGKAYSEITEEIAEFLNQKLEENLNE